MTGRVFFQVGVIVTDLEAAMDELSLALGLSWTEPARRQLGADELRVVFSKEGPPYIELIESGPGGGWDSSAGPHLDHLGFWSPDVDGDRERLAALGLPLLVDGRSLSGLWMYHGTTHSGMRIEHIDETLRERFLQRVVGGRKDPQTVVDAYFAGINSERYDDVAALFAEDAELTAPGVAAMRSRPEIANYFSRALQLYPEHADIPTRFIRAGDSMTVEIQFRGALASGQPIEFHAVDVFDFNEAAQISRLSSWYDSHELRRTLRAVSST